MDKYLPLLARRLEPLPHKDESRIRPDLSKVLGLGCMQIPVNLTHDSGQRGQWAVATLSLPRRSDQAMDVLDLQFGRAADHGVLCGAQDGTRASS